MITKEQLENAKIINITDSVLKTFINTNKLSIENITDSTVILSFKGNTPCKFEEDINGGKVTSLMKIKKIIITKERNNKLFISFISSDENQKEPLQYDYKLYLNYNEYNLFIIDTIYVNGILVKLKSVKSNLRKELEY